MSHFVNNVLENSFLKNCLMKFLIEALIVLILTHSLNENKVHNQNMIFTQIVVTNFHEKLRKISFMSFREIQIIKDVCKQLRNWRMSKY